MEKSNLEYERGMSDNVMGWAGRSKIRPWSLTKAEWAEYLKFAEQRRQIDLLAMPTHRFKSLYLIDVSHWHIVPAQKQSASGRQLLAERKALMKLVQPVE